MPVCYSQFNSDTTGNKLNNTQGVKDMETKLDITEDLQFYVNGIKDREEELITIDQEIESVNLDIDSTDKDIKAAQEELLVQAKAKYEQLGNQIEERAATLADRKAVLSDKQSILSELREVSSEMNDLRSVPSTSTGDTPIIYLEEDSVEEEALEERSVSDTASTLKTSLKEFKKQQEEEQVKLQKIDADIEEAITIHSNITSVLINGYTFLIEEPLKGTTLTNIIKQLKKIDKVEAREILDHTLLNYLTNARYQRVVSQVGLEDIEVSNNEDQENDAIVDKQFKVVDEKTYLDSDNNLLPF